MLDMALEPRKKKPATGKRPVRQEAAETSRERSGSNLNVWIQTAIMEAFEASRKRARRTKTAHIEAILEEALAREGLWPPSKQAPAD